MLAAIRGGYSEYDMTNEGRERLRALLPSFQHPDWSVDTDQHCRAVEQHLHQVLKEHFPLPRAQKKTSYIPDTVWCQREQKLRFKKRVRHRSRLWRDLICRAFMQWKEKQDFGVVALLGKQRRLYELAAAAVKIATRSIRKAILSAKNEFLNKVACEGHQGAAKILQRVKQAGIGGTKARPISRPLPWLLHPEDGTSVTTRQQRDEVWMLHFGKQEQGHAKPIADFIQEAAFSCYQADVDWTVEMLPNYADVEQVLRDIPRNKAAGLDNLPGEVLKAVPAESARLLLPLFLKSMITQHQPLQWRGGILFEAFKRSGWQSSVDNYRSLFVSSYLAKAYHRVVRNKTQALCRDDLHPLHLGSKKRAPVAFASMFVHAHLRRSSALAKSVSVLFLDTSAAYYRIVRELAVGDIRSDHTVVHLFKRFGLTGEDLRDMMSTVQSGDMLAQSGAPDALRQVVKDIHLHTWFVSRFSDGSHVCSSMAGSRPGESWADLIYAYIYGRVLCKIHEFAVAEELTFHVPYDPSVGVFPAHANEGPLAATDATWADDSAFPLVADEPEDLMRRTCRLCTLVISFCEGHGMAPNLKPGKTSVMIRLSGRGHKKVRKAYFPNGTQRLALPDLGVGIVVADHYKHLGGFVDCKLTMRPEMRHRLAQASSSYDSAKTLLLGNSGSSSQYPICGGAMTTPIKSPVQKRHKGDEGPDDDLQVMSVSQNVPQQSVTLSAIEQLLDKKLDPMHQFLQQIHFDLNAFKESVRVEFETVGLRITETEKKAAETMTRLEELEREMGKMRAPARQEIGNSRFLSMVVGNIPDVSSLEEAKAWLNKHCVKCGLTPPSSMDVYTKGSFSNLIFVKCQSETHRDRFIQSIRDFSKFHRDSTQGEVASSSRLFAKVDLPFEIRTVEGALYSMKKMLVSWNFNALAIKYDIHKGVLAVGGREIVKVRVQDFSLKFEWCDGEWQTWEELQESPEMTDIANKAHTRLEKAKAKAFNKGKGKGPE